MLIKFGTANSLLALTVYAGLATATAAFAQDSEQVGAQRQVPLQLAQAAPDTMNPMAITDERLDRFANVNVKAQEIQEKYKTQVDSAKTMEDLNRVQQKMNSELIDAIQSQDISVEEYQQLSTTVQQDPELLRRVTAKITEKMQSQDQRNH
jgi:predicted transglutaminase-like cysteine proteinase